MPPLLLIIDAITLITAAEIAADITLSAIALTLRHWCRRYASHDAAITLPYFDIYADWYMLDYCFHYITWCFDCWWAAAFIDCRLRRWWCHCRLTLLLSYFAISHSITPLLTPLRRHWGECRVTPMLILRHAAYAITLMLSLITILPPLMLTRHWYFIFTRALPYWWAIAAADGW